MTEDRRPLVIYHAACRDGFAAAYSAWLYFRNRGGADFHEGFYGQEPPFDRAAGRDVYNLVEEMQFEGLRVVFDNERSGAGISWDYFFSRGTCEDCGARDGHQPGCAWSRPWFIDYVEDRDLWRYALPESRAVNAFLGAVPFEFEAWDELLKMPLADAVKAGEAIRTKIRQYAAEVGKNAFRIEIDGHKDVPLVNAPQCDVSELLETLMDSTGSPIAMAWWQRADRVFQYSLRSRGDIDVSAIAKAHGGGGHKNASGFQVPEIWHR